MIIPQNEIENVESIYWQMLMCMESRCGQNDVLDKMLVEAAYDVWNRTHPDDVVKYPRWLDGEHPPGQSG